MCVQMFGVFEGLFVVIEFCMIVSMLDSMKSEPSAKLKGIVGCFMCCCGLCGIVVPLWVFLSKIILVYIDLQGFCSGNDDFDELEELLFAHWGYILLNLCVFAPIWRRVNKHRTADMQVRPFTARYTGTVTSCPRLSLPLTRAKRTTTGPREV